MPRTIALIVLLAVSALAAGCGSDGAADADPIGETATTEVETPDVLRGLDESSRTLTTDDLATDALEPESLATTLESAGFTRGEELEWTGRTETFNHVVLRTLSFDGQGGEDYLAWLEENAGDVLGTVAVRTDLPLGEDGRLYRDENCGCRSDYPTFLAAWRDGSVVRTVLADGPDVDRERFLALARVLG